MIAALGGVLTLFRSKAAQWALAISAAIGAVVSFALYERRAGAESVRTDELKREVADAHTVSGIATSTARESQDEVLADLLKEARR